MGCATAIVSRRAHDLTEQPAYTTLADALAAHGPDYVVVADETARHHETLSALTALCFRGRVLVEKPLFAAPAALPDHGFAALGVGYNLRFHPAVQALRRALDNRPALTVNASVGQYLPDWRPGTDYRLSYSADAARGGGVLRDLSHELDLLIWQFGPAAGQHERRRLFTGPTIARIPSRGPPHELATLDAVAVGPASGAAH
jgi:predicted dehydrogenase